jgi:hypothetical protein
MELASRNLTAHYVYPYSAKKSGRSATPGREGGKHSAKSSITARRATVEIQAARRVETGKQGLNGFCSGGSPGLFPGSKNGAVSPLLESNETGGPGRGLFEPDIVLPSQFFATLARRAPIKRGECQLLIAVLEDAVHCFQKYVFARTRRERRLFDEAEAWMMRCDAVLPEDDRPALSFEYICAALGLDPDYLRYGLKRWREHELTGTSAQHSAALSPSAA